VTVETARVPAQPRTVRPAAPAVPAGRPWRRVVTRAILVPFVVLLPLVTLTPTADHRFNVYSNGGRFAADPLLLPWSVVESVPTYLALGTFRPLGRLVEWLLDVVAFAGTGLLGIPANIGLRLVSFAAAILMTLVAVLLAEAVTARGRLFAAPPSALVTLVPFAVGAGLVAADNTSTTVLFGGLYFTSAALVLAVAAWACRTRKPGALVVLAGAGLAAFNEIAYLAVPLATAVVLIRAWIVRTPGRRPGVRFAVLLWAGFLPVFVPVRALIYRHCAGGDCYTGSDIALGGAPATFPQRLVAWLPPLQWQSATDHLHPLRMLPILVLAVLIVLAVRTPRGVRADRRQALGLAAVAVVILVLGATLSSLNGDVQTMSWGQGWRESGLTAAAGGLLLAAAGHRLMIPALAVLVTAAMFSATANKEFRDSGGGDQFPYLHDRIAQEVADFDRTPAGDVRRCALRDAFIQTSIANHKGVYAWELKRVDRSLDRATKELAGHRFCSKAPR
jgi:hypothetical protein